MQISNTLRLGVCILLAGSLAACGGRDRGSGGITPEPGATATPSPVSFQSKFGSAFAAVFNAPATGDPIDPTDASVPPLAPASDPLDN